MDAEDPASNPRRISMAEPRKSLFDSNRKRRQSIGAYTSLFARKLIAPLGFYREIDKYNKLKDKFINEPDKLDALDEMWRDYQKYQIRKRFKWPPNLFFNRFFWTTGYYADYQKQSRATKLRKPGEDSSDEEFIDPRGQFLALGDEDDINLMEFNRYRQAKKLANPNRSRSTRFREDPDEQITAGDEGIQPDYLVDRRPTVTRLFDDDGSESQGGRRKSRRKSKSKKKDAASEVEEVETIVEVEYTLIKDPNKKKKKKGKDGDTNNDSRISIPGLSEEDAMALQKAYEENLASGGKTDAPKLKSRRRSVAVTTTDDATGEKLTEVEETNEPIAGIKSTSKRKSMMFPDEPKEEYTPARHSLETLSTIWTTVDDNLRKQYSTHTLTVTNLPDKVSINHLSQLFPGAKVNLKTPKKQGEQPYATVRFKDEDVCRQYFLEARNMIIEGKNLVVNPKVKTSK